MRFRFRSHGSARHDHGNEHASAIACADAGDAAGARDAAGSRDDGPHAGWRCHGRGSHARYAAIATGDTEHDEEPRNDELVAAARAVDAEESRDGADAAAERSWLDAESNDDADDAAELRCLAAKPRLRKHGAAEHGRLDGGQQHAVRPDNPAGWSEASVDSRASA